jgi:hypothetical protein
MTMKNNEPRSATKGEDEDGGEAGRFRITQMHGMVSRVHGVMII